ncbi:GlxA family transcriptional regulator [Aquihabitans sp. G128]|uniref:GlxA family transcriptional regulator n=1 Tax=Aquihabitans sp. G128 TaxID=2849779 RepID=UPI00352E82A4
MRRQVAFVLLPQVHLLDLAGPAQAFSSADDLGWGYQLHFVGESARVPSAQGLGLEAATTWPDLGPSDLVLVPGFRARLLDDPGQVSTATLDRLRAHHAAGGRVGSICAGAEVLGRAGLLDGRRCTTHHGVQAQLAARHPAARVQRDVLYAEDDRVLTSAGIASGIDLALHLVATDHGPAAAAAVARDMVVYARRNGDAEQDSALLRHRNHLDDLVHRVQDEIDRRFAEPLPLAELAARAPASTRTLHRAFVAATGLTPLAYQRRIRVEHARAVLASGATVEAAAAAAGYDDARQFRRVWRAETGTAPGQAFARRPA